MLEANNLSKSGPSFDASVFQDFAGAASQAASFPFILKDDEEDTACQSNRNRIRTNQRPSRRDQAIGQPQRYPEGEHHIHREREPIRLTRTDDHNGLGQERGGGKESGNKANRFNSDEVWARHLKFQKRYQFQFPSTFELLPNNA